MQRIKKLFSIVILIFSDIAALLASFLMAYFLRSVVLLSIIPRFRYQESLPLDTQLRLGFAYGAVVIILVLFYGGLYTQRFSFWEETKHLLKCVSISFIFILVLVFVSRQYIYFSRATIVLAWLLSLVIFPFFRFAVKKILVRTGLWKKRVIIFGTNDTSRLLAAGIESSRTLGYEIVGFLSEKEQESGKTFCGVDVVGSVSDGKKVSSQMHVRDFIVSLPSFSQEELVKVMEDCDEYADTIRMVPNIGSLITLGVKVENFGDVLALNLNRNLMKPWNILLKHLFEYILIFVFLAVLLPLFMLIAICIKLDSRGPVFFLQDRLGKKGRRFKIIKFRSMYVDGDQKLAEYFTNHPEVKKEWEKFQKIKGYDPRVTKVGKFIRKFSLDEIPQLLNMIKGDMSLVGPRPYLPREIDILKKSYEFISRIKPGLTGLWQVRGRNLLPFKQRIILDEYYIRTWSLWLDIVILLKTPKVLVKREGAF